MSWWDDLKKIDVQPWKPLGIDVNLNPFKSSMYTGAGTPWGEGPQDPYKANYKAFNPDDYQGMDTTGLGRALRQDIGQGAARAKGRLQGTLQRGGGGGADLISGLAGLEAQQGQDESTLMAKLAAQDYEQRYNQWRDMMGFEERKANQDLQRYARDKEQRDAPMQFAGQVAGGLAGAMGGGVGAGLGSSLSKKWFG